MSTVQKADDFLRVVESALTKEYPQFFPTKAPVKIKNYPDLGDTNTPRYSSVEKAVQNTENADSYISNASVIADLAKKLPLKGVLQSSLNGISKVGQVFEPLQMALWGTDAARTLLDPGYRDQSKEGLEQNLEENRSSPIKAALNTVASIYARPNSTIKALLDIKAQIDLDRANQESKSKSLDRQARDRANDLAVPPISADTIQRDQAIKRFK